MSVIHNITNIDEDKTSPMYDLMIGLMLPSGNDAANVLAENFGRYLCIEMQRNSSSRLKDSLETDPYD